MLFLPGIVAVGLGVVGLRRSGRLPLPIGRGLSIAAITIGGASIGIGTAAASALMLTPDTQIVVDRVIDGDTVDVVRGGDTVRIRLLNVDTPETKDPDEPVECLGPEATEFLQAMLPAGTPVTLEYDVDRTDRYGRDLAGVFLADNTFVNAEIARAGFGRAVVFEPNEKFYPRVSEAEDEARAAGRGLFGTDIACMKAAAQAKTYQQSVSALLGKAPGSGAKLAKIDAYADLLAKKIARGEEIARALARDESADRAQKSSDKAPGDLIARQLDRLSAEQQDNAQTRKRAVQRIEQAREAERAAEEARRKAEEEATAREAASRDTAGTNSSSNSSSSDDQTTSSSGTSSDSGGSDDSSSGSSGGGAYDPSYTGCRAYRDTGRWLDDQGRRYDKIDCTTKQIIG
ncbi:thermonuclease family protein [Myceligenerans pegani]|uniref:Thermonuclease family protein n=1 Tax=Myceligenerans pegani TaxID=2776917 RepID=A0ABR9MVN2_9MICO|nr:thermonuclease family protein [Myceligenerans sp. TRM 65318]MBE1875448.1 thermonuclease family protein [Myceligenerans sp. TRM 65318]MBE3017719.1 thermonuclease family protein [Myceligenerans sp. TRM 65318]